MSEGRKWLKRMAEVGGPKAKAALKEAEAQDKRIEEQQKYWLAAMEWRDGIIMSMEVDLNHIPPTPPVPPLRTMKTSFLFGQIETRESELQRAHYRGQSYMWNLVMDRKSQAPGINLITALEPVIECIKAMKANTSFNEAEAIMVILHKAKEEMAKIENGQALKTDHS